MYNDYNKHLCVQSNLLSVQESIKPSKKIIFFYLSYSLSLSLSLFLSLSLSVFIFRARKREKRLNLIEEIESV